jgi:phosphoenolpyruvate synthase/pyruvate phosphate dikinase
VQVKVVATLESRAMAPQRNVRWFGEIGVDEVAEVGGKNASLGQLYSVLSVQGVRVPNGFALTAAAYRSISEIRSLPSDPQCCPTKG